MAVQSMSTHLSVVFNEVLDKNSGLLLTLLLVRYF